MTWSFEAPATGTYTFDTLGSVGYDTVLSVLDGCGGATLGCSDDTVPGAIQQSTVTVDLVVGQTVIVVVDGWGAASRYDGDYVLAVH